MTTWPDRIGGLGLFALLLFFQLNATVAYVGLGFIVLAFLTQAQAWRPLLRHDAASKLFLCISVYLLGYAVWASMKLPDTTGEQRTAVLNWLNSLLFIPVAWQIYLRRQHLNGVLSLLALGLVIRVLLHFDWTGTAPVTNDGRMGFGLAETVFAPIAGMVALGFLLLGPRLSRHYANRTKLAYALATAAWLLLLGLVLESLILSQTRGVWLAAVLVFPFGLWLRYRHATNAGLVSFRGVAVALGLLGLLGVFIGNNYATISQRLNAEQLFAAPPVSTRIFEGQEVLVTTSIGYRKILWGIGWQKWLNSPLFGWGPGSTDYLIKQEKNILLSQSVKLKDGTIETLHMPHLHNFYLELLVRFGVSGSLLFLALPCVLLHGIAKAKQQAVIPNDYAVFLMVGWCFLGVAALFDFQLFKFAWRNFCLIWAALSFAVLIEARALAPKPITGQQTLADQD